jgi:hypothetical protein
MATESIRIKCAGCVEYIGEMRNARKMLGGKPEEITW